MLLPDDRASDSCHSDMCTSPPGLGDCGASQFVYIDAPGSDDAGVGNRSFSETPDFASDHDPGPGKPSPGFGVVLEMPDCVCDIDTGPGKPSPKFGGMLELPGFASDSNQGPGKISPESGDMLAVSDFVSDHDPGPGEPLLRSGVSLNMPNFAAKVDKLRMPDFVSAIGPESGTTSPGFGDTLAAPDFVSDIDPGPGEPLLESAVVLDRQTGSISLVTANELQIQDLVGAIDSWPGTTSPGFGDTLAVPDFVSNIDPGPGQPLLESGVRLDRPHFASDCDILQMQDFVYAINPEFVATLTSRTPVSAQPQLDVIQLCPSSSRSGWSTLLSGAGMLLSAVSALLRWDFLCNIRVMARCELGAHKGPLYGYACVRCGYTNGLHTAIDGLLIDVAYCLWCLLLGCAGLSDQVFRCSGCHTCNYFPGVSPGMSRIMTVIVPLV